MFEKRKAAKEYLAVVYGHLEKDESVVDAPIAEYKPKVATQPQTLEPRP